MMLALNDRCLYVEFSLILSCMAFVFIFVIPLKGEEVWYTLLPVLRTCAVLSLSFVSC